MLLYQPFSGEEDCCDGTGTDANRYGTWDQEADSSRLCDKETDSRRLSSLCVWSITMGQTHDVTIDPIEQEVVFEDDGKGNTIMRLVMKALEEKNDG